VTIGVMTWTQLKTNPPDPTVSLADHPA